MVKSTNLSKNPISYRLWLGEERSYAQFPTTLWTYVPAIFFKNISLSNTFFKKFWRNVQVKKCKVNVT